MAATNSRRPTIPNNHFSTRLNMRERSPVWPRRSMQTLRALRDHDELVVVQRHSFDILPEIRRILVVAHRLPETVAEAAIENAGHPAERTAGDMMTVGFDPARIEFEAVLRVDESEAGAAVEPAMLYVVELDRVERHAHLD